MAYHVYAEGTGNIATTLAPGREYQLEEVRVHLASVGSANDFTVTLQSAEGTTEYDIVLFTQDMSSVTDVQYLPTRPLYFRDGDVLSFAWTNGSNIQYGLEIVYN
jgi:hypothetical protein